MPRRVDPQPGLGEAMRELRARNGLSQVEVAKRSGIHSTWISHLESGRINPTWGNVRRIASALGVALGEFADLAQHYEGEFRGGRVQPADEQIDLGQPRLDERGKEELADLVEAIDRFRHRFVDSAAK